MSKEAQNGKDSKGRFVKGHKLAPGGARPGSGRKPSEYKFKLQKLADNYDDLTDIMLKMARNDEHRDQFKALAWCLNMVTPMKQTFEVGGYVPADAESPTGKTIAALDAVAREAERVGRGR